LLEENKQLEKNLKALEKQRVQFGNAINLDLNRLEIAYLRCALGANIAKRDLILYKQENSFIMITLIFEFKHVGYDNVLHL
jgi:hypothetical protein